MKTGDILFPTGDDADHLSDGAQRILTAATDTIKRGFTRGLSLSDNIECEVGSANFTHDTPLNYRLKSLPSANGIFRLSENGHVAVGGPTVSGGQERSVRITYKFLDSSASQVKCWFVLFREGEGARQPTFLPQAWVAPTLLNSWVNFGGAYINAGYMKDAFGRVWLRGVVKNGSASGAVIMTLPAGYRPSATMNFATWSAGAAVIEIGTAGNVQVAAGGATTDVSLNTISFDTR